MSAQSPELAEIEKDLMTKTTRYSDTVMVSSALHDFFGKHKEVGKFIGIELDFKNKLGAKVTPDVSSSYDDEKNFLFLELKWSLPNNDALLEKEIKELEKYSISCSNSHGKEANYQDLVLVCHLDDQQRIVEKIKAMSNQLPFLKQDGFAVWAWTLTLSKSGQQREEELRLFSVYGKTRNDKIERLVIQPGGILFPDDVLTYLLFQFTFVREKPPVQYTMAVLIENILTSLSRESDKEKVSQDVHIDMIYERANAFFPSWHKYDDTTIQIKRKWIREAVEQMCDIGLCRRVIDKEGWYNFPIPVIHRSKHVQAVLCRKLAKVILKQRNKKRGGRPKTSVSRPKPSPSDKSLTPFLK